MADEESGICGCAICGGRHLYGVDVGQVGDCVPVDDPGKGFPWPTVADGYEHRIEALRAASRIVAGIKASGGNPKNIVTRVDMPSAKATIDIAEQFARWLEDGER